jgi:hypothetical protein
MKEMKVKVYREPENESLVLSEEELADYHNLIESLGLKNTVPVEDRKVPNVYVNLNSDARIQLKAVCPRYEKIEDYVKTTIPLEVLKVYEFAKNNEMFDYYEIWYNDKAPDPMLVGFKYENEKRREENSTWNGTYSLLARWGDEALELEQLIQLGYTKIKQSLLDNTEEILYLCRNIKENPDLHVRKYIKGDLQSYLNISPTF